MAIASTCVWECRDTGASTNGGGYVSGGTDYSQQDSPQLALTDIAIADNTTTTITSATGGFTSAMVGNIIYLTGGSGGTLTTQRRQITAVTDSNTITVDRAPAPTSAMTNVTGNVGGALSGPWDVHSSSVGSDDYLLGNTIYIKYGTYNRSGSWTSKNVGSGTTTTPVHIVGYDTNRNLYNWDSNRPTINMTTNSTPLFYQQGMAGLTTIRNIIFSNTASVKSIGVYAATASSSTIWINCKFTGFSNALSGRTSASQQVNARMFFCEIANCTGSGVVGGTNSGTWTFTFCYIHDNGGSGFTIDVNAANFGFSNSIIVNNGAHGVVTTSSNTVPNTSFLSCIIANNTNSQILTNNNSPASTSTSAVRLTNCIIYGGQYCIRNSSNNNTSTSLDIRYAFKNAIGGASISNLGDISAADTDIILTEDPFADSANRDYRLNRKPKGGNLCRNMGWPILYPSLDNFRNCTDLGFYQSKLETVCL